MTPPGGGDRGARVQPRLGEDAVDVVLDGGYGDDEFGGDLGVALARGEQRGDLAFAGGQLAVAQHGQRHHLQYRQVADESVSSARVLVSSP